MPNARARPKSASFSVPSLRRPPRTRGNERRVSSVSADMGNVYTGEHAYEREGRAPASNGYVQTGRANGNEGRVGTSAKWLYLSMRRFCGLRSRWSRRREWQK